jgi:hypothetical protein
MALPSVAGVVKRQANSAATALKVFRFGWNRMGAIWSTVTKPGGATSTS